MSGLEEPLVIRKLSLREDEDLPQERITHFLEGMAVTKLYLCSGMVTKSHVYFHPIYQSHLCLLEGLQSETWMWGLGDSLGRQCCFCGEQQ